MFVNVQEKRSAKYFERVFGSEMDGTRADKSDLLAYALAETCIEAADCAMIGDREHDMIGAVNNALYGVGALYGYGTRQELQASGATSYEPRASSATVGPIRRLV